MQNNKFYKIKDVAEMSGLSKHFIRKSILEKQLNAIKTGKVFFIQLEDFNKFINNLKVIKDGKRQNSTKKDYFSFKNAKSKDEESFANMRYIWE